MKGQIMGNSGLDALAGLLIFFGFILVFLLVATFLSIQYLNLVRELRATPPHVLPPHALRRSVMLVLTELTLLSLMNLFPAANRDRWTVTSFLTSIVGSVVVSGLILTATIWWEMRRKAAGNQTHSDV